jgi:Subtilase family
MPPGKLPRYRAGVTTIAALAFACSFAPAQAVAGRAGDGNLSMRLTALSKASIRSAPQRQQARELSLPTQGPGSLLRQGNRVLVEVRFDGGAAASVGELRDAGMRVVDVSRSYRTVTVAAKPAELRRLSTVPGVVVATEVLAPMVYGTGGGGATTSAVTPCFGAATSEGDEQLRAALARELFAVDGEGMTVGILSDSFDQDSFAATSESEDIASGDLPGPGNPCGHENQVDILDDTESEGEDEGRGMAQIVHDLAPGAQLSFATAFTGLTAFAGNVEALEAAGADVISDDVFYFEEPFFQEGPVGVAVSNVTAAGVTYFSSAGNNNLISGGKDIGSWEAPQYRDSLGCPSSLVAFSEFLEEEGEAGLNPDHCMDFDPGAGTDQTFGITVAPGAELIVDLQWAEAWEGVGTDLDAFLLDASGEPIAGSIESNVVDTQRPFELIGWENNAGKSVTVRLVINRFSGSEDPPLKFAIMENGEGVSGTEYPESSEGDVVGPTIFGHNGAEDAVSVGAVPAPPFYEEAPEPFSSRGPVTHYFEPVDGTTTPAEPLASPLVLPKPDVVATDGGANTFFGSCVSNTWRFFGTSAAAPHAAAVAALERQAVPGATVEEVKNAQFETAGPVGTFPQPGFAIGAGLLNAAAAIAKLKSEPFVEPPVQPGSPAPKNCNLPKPPPPIPVAPDTPVTNPSTNPDPGRDSSAPRTAILQHPPKVIRTRQRTAKAVFRFGADESGVTFLCRVDRAPFRTCKPRLERRFRLGPHVVRVKARDAAGNVDSTPVLYRFTVKPLLR